MTTTPHYTLWHHPGCSKSRAALALLSPLLPNLEVYLYQASAPSVVRLKGLLKALGREPWELARLKDTLADTLHLSELPRERVLWLDLLSAHPALIERPILECSDGRARIGRPPEDLLALLEETP